MPTEENGSIGSHYLPSVQAWNKYKNEGGQGEYKARAGGTRQDSLVQLAGLPSYWWRLSDLLPCTPPQPAPAPIVKLYTVEDLSTPSKIREPAWRIEVPTREIQSVICVGDLQIEYDDSEEDEDCLGEDCGECDGEGCRVAKLPLTATSLLDHLLEDYGNSAESYAEEHGVDRSDVDSMYRDLLVLVKNLRHQS
jgi:hypothetical protein